jgi:hypothetical protein
MIRKRPIDSSRLRRPPEQFSWLDQRLVRERRLRGCPPDALALYLFLAVVADAEGLSYYADTTVAEHLTMDPARVAAARSALLRAELIAYQAPLYQLLSLDHPLWIASPPAPRGDAPRSFADILAGMGGAR